MDSGDEIKSGRTGAASSEETDLPLTAREVLEAAYWLEKSGIEFFRMLSETVEHEKLRQFFLRLMGMEMEHEKLVREMMDDLGDAPERPEKLGFDESLTHREYFLHMRAMVEKNVFPQEFSFFADLDGYTSPEDALPMARKIEERTIELYRSLSRFKMPYRKQAVIKKLITEEESHLEEIEKILAAVS